MPMSSSPSTSSRLLRRSNNSVCFGPCSMSRLSGLALAKLPNQRGLNMTHPLRILHLEDNPRDAELIRATIEDDGLHCEITHVKSREEFESTILARTFDVILSDFALPHYNGLTALDFA